MFSGVGVSGTYNVKLGWAEDKAIASCVVLSNTI